MNGNAAAAAGFAADTGRAGGVVGLATGWAAGGKSTDCVTGFRFFALT